MLSPSPQKLTVCTIFEGEYHLGGAALVNSLIAQGYAGKVWIGTRGTLPWWVKAMSQTTENCYSLLDLELCFIQLQVKRTMSAEKPQLMLRILEELEPDAQGIAYFDADVVLNTHWTVITDWIQRGVALCEDNCFGFMAADHLLRAHWIEFAAKAFPSVVLRPLSRSYNAGFVGVSRRHVDFLQLWNHATSLLPIPSPTAGSLKVGNRWNAFSSMEQDTLNVTAMACKEPLVTLGPEGMGFTPGLNAMMHAVDNPKPWKKWYVWHLLRKGVGVGPADRAYWSHATGPLTTWSLGLLWLHRLDMTCAIILSRFYHSA